MIGASMARFALGAGPDLAITISKVICFHPSRRHSEIGANGVADRERRHTLLVEVRRVSDYGISPAVDDARARRSIKWRSCWGSVTGRARDREAAVAERARFDFPRACSIPAITISVFSGLNGGPIARGFQKEQATAECVKRHVALVSAAVHRGSGEETLPRRRSAARRW